MNDLASIDTISILSALAEGIDPFTGEVLPEEHLLQNPRIVRALFHSINAIHLESRMIQKNSFTPILAGSTWTKQEDEVLVQQFNEKLPLSEIAKLHDRSRGAIKSRLVHLGIILAPHEPSHTASDT